MSNSNSAPQFSPIEMIKASWEPVTNNAGPLIGGMVLVAIINAAASSIRLVPFAGLLVVGPLQYGLFAVALAACRRQPTDIQIIFSGFQRFVPTFVAGLLIGIFTMIGMVLCVVPGIIVTMVYSLTYLYMLEDGLDFWPAMEKSRITVMNNFGQWVLLGLCLFGLNVLGALACGVGLFLTGPMSLVVVAMAYELERKGAGGLTAPPDLTPSA